MKLALAQMQMVLDIDENYQKSLDYLREAKRNGAELICFPEVQLSPFDDHGEIIGKQKMVHVAQCEHLWIV